MDKRFYLLTTPRTASHLLTRILALDTHDNVLPYRPGADGYFFLPSYSILTKHKLYGKRLEDWSSDERQMLRQSYQDDFDKMSGHLEAAEKQGKIVFIKEHVNLLVEPAAISDYLHTENQARESPWRIKLFESTATEYETLHSIGYEVPPRNITILPDEFLRTWKPIFLIRHPALAFPSIFRARRDVEGVIEASDTKADEAPLHFLMNCHWNRKLYDWYATNRNHSESEARNEVTWPLVLDADDLINDPAVVVRLCEIVGLDPAKLKFSWTPDVEPSYIYDHASERAQQASKRMSSTLIASSGVMKDKVAGNIDIDIEAKKWKHEFGESRGQMIERQVRAAMDDYEYLKARRLTLVPN